MVLTAVLDPRLVVHAHDVGILVVREREARVGQEPAEDKWVSEQTTVNSSLPFRSKGIYHALKH